MSSRARTITAGLVCIALLALAWGCGRAPESPTGLPWTAAELRVLRSMTPLPGPGPSPTNPYADDPGAAELGKELFFDAGLSANGEVSCASCHEPERYFTDGRKTAEGIGELTRNTPTVVGLTRAPFLMWDGRKDSLWSQALAPLFGELEMGSTPEAIAEHVRASYADEYEGVFGRPADSVEALELCVDVARAIAAYERTLRPEPAPFDRFVAELLKGDPRGGDHMTRRAVQGLRLFIGRGGCVGCHSGPWMTDHAFHALGLAPANGEADPGRARGIELLVADAYRADGPWGGAPDRGYERLDSGHAHHKGAFKTPSLRNVGLTGPYGHAGQYETLEEMLRFYADPARRDSPTHLDPLLADIPEDLDVEALVALLEAFTSPQPSPAEPPL